MEELWTHLQLVSISLLVSVLAWGGEGQLDAFLGFWKCEVRKPVKRGGAGWRPARGLEEVSTHLRLLTSALKNALVSIPLLVRLAWHGGGRLDAFAGFQPCQVGQLGKKEAEPEGGPGAWKKSGPICSC